MRGWLLAILLLISWSAGAAEVDPDLCSADSPARIEVAVEGLENDKGLLTVELYRDDPEGFLKKSGRIWRVRVPAQDRESVCIAAPGPGRYALAVFHDENANEKFDRSFIGLPKEGFGFSRNPKIRMGPPDFAEVAFDLTGEEATLAIRMIYW